MCSDFMSVNLSSLRIAKELDLARGTLEKQKRPIFGMLARTGEVVLLL